MRIAFHSLLCYNILMKIFILQKSIADIKSPTVRKIYETNAATVGEFICEMVDRNAAAKAKPCDKIELFDALEKSRADRYVYEDKKAKFSPADMREFALQAFADKIYLIKNVTKNINYESISDLTEFSENDEIALIKLKYVRGVI